MEKVGEAEKMTILRAYFCWMFGCFISWVLGMGQGAMLLGVGATIVTGVILFVKMVR